MDTHFPLFLYIITTSSFLLITLPLSHGEEDDYYTACNTTYSCGNITNISYPFWGQNRLRNCGSSNSLELKCDQNGNTSIEIGSQNFPVISINQSPFTMRLVRNDLVSSSCPSHFTNTSLNSTFFHYNTQTTENLTLFYKCPQNFSESLPRDFKNYFTCQSEGDNQAFYGYQTQVQKYQEHLLKCGGQVSVPVSREVPLGNEGGIQALRQLLKQGFDVQYFYSRDFSDCAACYASRGMCGTGLINTSLFSCYCRDGAHDLMCSQNVLTSQMALQISFHYHKPPQIYISVIFISLVKLVLSVNPKFEACTPRTCGNGPTIKYPFWIPEEQDYFCGHPQFEVRCDHKNSILRISNTEILLKAISYSNSSFMATNMAVYEENCPAPKYNFSLDQTPFSYTSDNANISFFYNCATEPVDYPTYEVDCAKNATHYSFAVFHKEALEKNYSLSECQLTVNALVRVNEAVNFTSLLQMNYTEILKMGFVLSWTASDCEDCEESGGRCGFDDHKFLCFCRDKPHTRSCDDGNQINVKNKVIVGVCASAFSVLVMLIAFSIYQRRKKMSYAKSYARTESISSMPSLSLEDPEKGSKYFGLPVFTYGELEEATNYFDFEREIGDGGFGTVYFGKLRDGRYVAVKRLYEKNYRRLEQFKTEVEILTRLRHQNLVSLYGCTSRHSRGLLLVYEYIPNGTLADHLHGELAKAGTLSWDIRMNIAIETASAIAYLHASDIIHRDVKSNNMLLDNHFTVKVADFGLSRLFPDNVTHISTAPQGTPGYMDPEYHENYQLTNKSDVYSFGVVLIELISSMPAVDITRHRHEINLSNMAISKIQSRALHELVDPNLGFDSDYRIRKEISAVAELAFQCLQSLKDMRPSMEEVLERLKDIQSDGKHKGKAEEIDISADDAVLLKNEPPPASPDSNLRSTSTTTPNDSR